MSSLEVAVITAYLGPLLEKHNSNETITYEDLTKSWQSALQAVSGISNNTTTSIKSKLTALHQSQLKAYRETAKAACMEWAEILELPDNSKEQTNLNEYVEKCKQFAESNQPNWTLSAVHKKLVYQKIEERATELYNATTESTEATKEDDDEEEEGEEMESNKDVTPNLTEQATSSEQPKKKTGILAKEKALKGKTVKASKNVKSGTKGNAFGGGNRRGRGRGKATKLL